MNTKTAKIEEKTNYLLAENLYSQMNPQKFVDWAALTKTVLKQKQMALFEWDEKKNKTNQEKHGLSFEDAKNVFDDPHRIQYINTRGNERRFITVGKVIKFIITVVYTVRSGLLRVISARQARKSEINDYLENKLKKEDDGK